MARFVTGLRSARTAPWKRSPGASAPAAPPWIQSCLLEAGIVVLSMHPAIQDVHGSRANSSVAARRGFGSRGRVPTRRYEEAPAMLRPLPAMLCSLAFALPESAPAQADLAVNGSFEAGPIIPPGLTELTV